MAKKKSSSIVIVILVVILLAIVAAGGYYVYNSASNDINGKAQKDLPYTLIIEKNDSEYEVSQKLYHNKIVISDALWSDWMNKNYKDFEYICGEYNLNANMSYEALAEKLKNPDVSHKGVKVCIPEGYNVMDISKKLEESKVCTADAFLEVCKSTEGFDYDWLSEVPDNPLIAFKLEGFLFPATYELQENSDPKDVAEEMLEAFDNHLTQDMRDFCDKHNMTLYEFITLVSIVQEEAFGNESAGNITSVFMNRLKKGSKLQSDVTYFYAAKLRDELGFSQEVYDAYYTYKCPALSVGPITNSGDAIVNAAVNYPETDYYFFFSDLQKKFHFAKNYDEFMQLQKKYPWKE